MSDASPPSGKKSETSAFSESSQCKFWLFDEKQLELLRKDALFKAIPKEYAQEFTYQESLQLQRFYIQKISEIAKILSLPDKVQATAITFFKRFYFHQSMTQYLPEHIMLTCVYLACKCEEHHIEADELGKQVNRESSFILQNELAVLESLKFHVNVYHPYRPLYGFIVSMKANQPSTLLDSLWNRGKEIITDSVLTSDLNFLYPPAQIALAILLYVSRTLNCRAIIEKLIEDTFSNSGQLDKLRNVLGDIETRLSHITKSHFTENDVSNIEYKLGLIHNKSLVH